MEACASFLSSFVSCFLPPPPPPPPPPSSSSISFAPKEYDVFISFRGEDTRRNFTSHLRDALRGKEIVTYMDDKLERGDEISPALSKAIEESHISVVVFSQDYASSKWCLDELVKIMECRNMGQDVIPVFYNVDPSHVRKQTGSYKKAFAEHERNFKYDKERLNKWKEALFEAANLAGLDSQTPRDDSNLIQTIVEDVLQKLERKYPPRESRCTFGIKKNLEPIESSLRKVRTIGIWGMGGIGKTTIAQCLFNKYSSQFKGSYFLANMREKSRSGMDAQALCNDVVFNLLGENERTSTFAKTRLSRKKVLLVLDDVSTSSQLTDLLEKLEPQNFVSGSRVIITSRDKHVLINGGVDKNHIHKVKELNFQESLQLFSLNAFKRNLPIEGYEELSKRAVDYAKGLPLALKVLGSFLQSRSKDEWESELTKLKKIPNEEIQGVLRLSYNGLNKEEKEIFLDIACFLKGDSVEHVISLLDKDFYARIGLGTLQDKALITIEHRVVGMHDLIQEMGWEIVREESIKEPGKRSRLWDPNEVYDVLKYNRGTEKIEGISLDKSEIRDLQLSVETFKKMINLRFLKVYSRCIRYSRVHLPSDKLRYLEWNGCLSKSLPLTFCPENLVELVMRDNHFTKLWDKEEEHDFVNLKRIDLFGSKQLMELPNFCKASQLENVDLSFCESLCQVHPSLLSLQKLVTLRLIGCKKLESLESEVHLISLRDLNVDGCPSLQKFSLSSEAMRELGLSDARIDILHSSIGRFSQLSGLTLTYLRLENLPIELSCLRNLKSLLIYGCPRLMIPKQRLHIILDGLQSLKKLRLMDCRYLELPDNICVLSLLEELDLARSNIECLPASIKQLTSLKRLDLQNCKRLCSLPELSQSIIDLVAVNCTSLETVITTMTSRLWRERIPLLLDFENCVRLDEHSVSYILEGFYSLIKQTAYGIEPERVFYRHLRWVGDPYRLEICLPGKTVPKWFKYRTPSNSITIELDRTLQIVAYAFCLVLSPFYPRPKKRCIGFGIEYCQYDQGEIVERSNKMIPTFWNEFEERPNKRTGEFCIWNEMNFDHVFLWWKKHYSSYVRKNHYSPYVRTTCNSEVSFEFNAFSGVSGDPSSPVFIKECGVYPIYGLEVSLTSHAEAEALYTGKKRRLC